MMPVRPLGCIGIKVFLIGKGVRGFIKKPLPLTVATVFNTLQYLGMIHQVALRMVVARG